VTRESIDLGIRWPWNLAGTLVAAAAQFGDEKRFDK